MYNSELKYKWDNKNVRDYEVKKGREEGLASGLAEGLASGLAEGLAQGIQEGEHKRAVEMAREMLADGAPVDQIVKYTKLSVEEIEAI